MYPAACRTPKINVRGAASRIIIAITDIFRCVGFHLILWIMDYARKNTLARRGPLSQQRADTQTSRVLTTAVDTPEGAEGKLYIYVETQTLRKL